MMRETYIGLMRGINVGGKNKLAMNDLITFFVAAGCVDVRTYIQSGNVIFRSSPTIARDLPATITTAIAERFGYTVPLVLRTIGELDAVLRNNPFQIAGAPEDELHVLFLADLPRRDRVSTLDQGRSPPDSFSVRGRDIYLWLPGGVANSKLSNAYFDSRLATTSTGRNWRTVTKLLELANDRA
jgi:uncharacterized protein (DUF1697 family)